MGKGILIIVVGGILTLTLVNLNNNSRLTLATEVAEEAYSNSRAKYICKATAEMLLSQLGDDNSFRVTTPVNTDWFGGDITYTVTDTVIGADSLVKLNVKAEYFSSVKTSKVVVEIQSGGYIPVAVKAAITTRGDIETSGNYVIDGRDHDLAGNVVPNKGVHGIWTTATYTQGNHTVGGCDDSQVDYIPTQPGNPLVIKTGQTYVGGYPNTPDEVIGGAKKGFPEGHLKKIAQSGAGGSQYATSWSGLTFPLSGITYVEGNFGPVALSGSGLLVVHNSTKTAILSNTSSSFTGLIIADDIDKSKADILGAIISLTATPANMMLMGNGNGNILYSKEALAISTNGLDVINSGFGKHRVIVKSWLE